MPRRRGDPQPTAPCAVLLASIGTPFSSAAVARAAAVSEGGPVAVLSIARIYGSSFGMPNPGLLPTKKERQDQLDLVARAVAALEGKGLEVDGQVAAARRAEKTIARVARLRQVRHVVMDVPTTAGWRRLVEGNPVRDVKRRLGPDVTVEGIGARTKRRAEH